MSRKNDPQTNRIIDLVIAAVAKLKNCKEEEIRKNACEVSTRKLCCLIFLKRFQLKYSQFSPALNIKNNSTAYTDAAAAGKIAGMVTDAEAIQQEVLLKLADEGTDTETAAPAPASTKKRVYTRKKARGGASGLTTEVSPICVEALRAKIEKEFLPVPVESILICIALDTNEISDVCAVFDRSESAVLAEAGKVLLLARKNAEFSRHLDNLRPAPPAS